MNELSTIPALFIAALIPMVSAGISFVLKEKFRWLTPLVSTVLILVAFIILLIPVLTHKDITEFYQVPWLSIGSVTLNAGILSTPVTRLMAAVVLFVSGMVHLFSIGYMANQKNINRYFGFLGLFTFTMLGLVFSSNLLITFCFWELMGFCSYRLIAHTQEKPETAQAATKAFILTKAGDVGFLIGLMILWVHAGTLELTQLAVTPNMWTTAAGVCIFLGVVGKSAQFPLFNWLPDAMQGPTPVSALIHAATMVAAGIFLLVQFVPAFTADTLLVMTWTGLLSALLGAAGAWFVTDIKKILAYSTISQLGLMVLALGIGETDGAYTHLLHHAFFKAGLFLSAGAIIHALHHANHSPGFNAQDIRNMGGLRKQMPFTFAGFAICAAALAGLPGTSGHLSKELILTAAHQQHTWLGIAVGLISFATPLYIFRLFWFAFIRSGSNSFTVQEAPWIMRIPILLLAAGSLSFIFYNSHLHSLHTVILNTNLSIPGAITFASVAVTATALLVAVVIRNQHVHISREYIFQTLLNRIDNTLAQGARTSGNILYRVDKNIIDGAIHSLAYSKVALAHVMDWTDRNLVDGTVHSVTWVTRGLGGIARTIINGKIQSYLLWAITGLLIFIIWMLY